MLCAITFCYIHEAKAANTSFPVSCLVYIVPIRAPNDIKTDPQAECMDTEKWPFPMGFISRGVQPITAKTRAFIRG